MNEPLQALGKALLLVGGTIILAGGLMLVLAAATRGGLKMLPGDILYRKGNFTFFFPIASMIVLSLVLTLLLNLALRLWRR